MKRLAMFLIVAWGSIALVGWAAQGIIAPECGHEAAYEKAKHSPHPGKLILAKNWISRQAKDREAADLAWQAYTRGLMEGMDVVALDVFNCAD